MGRYEAVLFDFDGVLFDSEPIHFDCWQQILKPFGIPLDWKTYEERCIGVTDRAMLAVLCELSNSPVDIEDLMGEYPKKKELFRKRMAAEVLPAEMMTLLRQLRGKYRLGVVTSSNIREVGPFLEASGVMPLLDTVVHGGEVERHKPDPGPYLLAMSRLSATRGIAIEDSRAGIASARGAGLDVVEIKVQSQVPELVRSALMLQREE